MFLAEALERKFSLEKAIEASRNKFVNSSLNLKTLSTDLDQIGILIDQAVDLDKRINETYAGALVTDTETISDILYYVTGLEYKSDLLGLAIQKILKKVF